MTTNSTQPARGTRDFLPDDVRRREYVINIVRGVYERYGFEPLETPAFENIETLLGRYGEEGNKLIFKILKRGEHEATGEADLALRYDLTVPLARVVAQYQNELPKFFKRYQIQPVWRADRPARGRFREFYQCDIDAIGSTSPVVEAEVLGAVSEVMTTLGFSDFVVRLNHRRVLTALLEAAGITGDKHGEALVALDKLDKIGADGVAKELAARGIDAAAASAALSCFAAVDEGPQATLARLRAVLGDHAAIRDLAAIVALAESTPAAGPHPHRSEPGARAVILHRRHHGDRRPGPGRQSRRRRPVRQPDRHVPRPGHPGVRLFARPGAHHRRHDRAQHVSGVGRARALST